MRGNKIFISVATAKELAEPESLEECLLCMVEAGLIASFTIHDDFVQVRPLDDKDFSLALLMMESTDYSQFLQSRRKLN